MAVLRSEERKPWHIVWTAGAHKTTHRALYFRCISLSSMNIHYQSWLWYYATVGLGWLCATLSTAILLRKTEPRAPIYYRFARK